MWHHSKQISILSGNLGKTVFIEKQILFRVKRNELNFLFEIKSLCSKLKIDFYFQSINL